MQSKSHTEILENNIFYNRISNSEKKKPKLNLCEIISLQLSTKNNAFYKTFGKKLDINLKKTNKKTLFLKFH